MHKVRNLIGVLGTPWVARTMLVLATIIAGPVCLFVGEQLYYEGPGQHDLQESLEVYQRLTCDMYLNALAKGEGYSAEDYFRDYNQILNIKRKYNLVDGMLLRMENGSRLEPIFQLFQENKLAGRITEQEIIAAREQYLEPHNDISDKEGSHAHLVASMGQWLWAFYLKYLWFALALYLIWIKAEDIEWRAFWRNPIRAFLRSAASLAGYPVVIPLMWIAQLKEFLGEAELRRTKTSLFQPLGKDELEMVREWTRKGLSLLEVRQELESRGLHARHRFTPALAATLLIATTVSLTPKFAEARGYKTEVTQTTVTQTDARAGPTASDATGAGHYVVESADIPPLPTTEPPRSGRCHVPQLRSRTIWRTREIWHIPDTLAA